MDHLSGRVALALGRLGRTEVTWRVVGIAFREVVGNLGLGKMFPTFGLSKQLPTLIGPVGRLLAAKRGQRAIVRCVFQCHLPQRTSQELILPECVRVITVMMQN
jgi:hypothetical protein